MIKELLEMLFIEKLSMSEAAHKLSVGTDDFQSRVEMLVHMGYIKEVGMAKGECDGNCWKCSKTPADPDDGGGEGKETAGSESFETRFSWYELTEKGRRLVGK